MTGTGDSAACVDWFDIQSDGHRPRVLSLCDRTGVMVEPWIAAGYDATIVDVQHDVGVVTIPGVGDEGSLTKVGADVRSWPKDAWGNRRVVVSTGYDIVFAFPPCTDLAKSGARWWKDKGLDRLITALEVVSACLKVCEASGAPYMIENPSGALSTHWRKPDHAFDPLDFGAYVLDGEDYTKLTNLWVGGGFSFPPKRSVPKSDAPNPIHWASPGDDRADRRSITPRGFARAVFAVNEPMVRRKWAAA